MAAENKRGGKRQNAGRKPVSISEKKIQITIQVQKKYIDKYSKKILQDIANKAILKYIENNM